jgi:cyclophilin family peptidyl-prolyl cis-trans isomerase
MFSLYRNAMQYSMQRYFEELRLLSPSQKEQWIAMYYGRAYWNASAVKRALGKLTGFDEEKFDRDLGIQKEKNRRGTLAMARTMDVNSATAQFFINLKDNTFLDHGGRDFGYAVFGKVSDGMDVVDAIAGVKTGNKGGHQDVPLEPVEILEVSIDE